MPTLIGKIEPGDVIGRCRIIRELGRGGVGTVYLATHQTLQIEVALKVLSPTLSLDNPALAERFIREAQLAARIRHPNVIAVMDAAHDEATGLYYIVLEYVGGGSLSWHLRNGPIPETKALAIITGIAHALVLAEENSVVHRDIKPDNIMLDLRGVAKLADLGLAKHAIDSRTSLTMGGSFMGTPAYMSPEQARDAKVADTRDDIYSLGATFFECLTGKPPFEGETPYNIMSELLTKPSPRPRDQQPGISQSTDLVCRKMMAKNRDLRYRGAQALLRDLQHAQMFGDAGLGKLEAATFDHESLQAREQALTYGVETSAEGVAMIPEAPGDSTITRPIPAIIVPRRADYGVFRAAFLLVMLVTMATLLLAWLGPEHPLLKNGFALITNHPAATPAVVTTTVQAPSPPTTAQNSHSGTVKNPVTSSPATIPVPREPTPDPSSHPELFPALTGENPATPVTAIPPNASEPTPGAVPAMAAAPDSAFAARTIAEAGLDKNSLDPTGHAQLLRIIGKRDKSEAVPTTWTFYFYDKNVSSTNARVVTVTGGKVTKNSSVIVDATHPFPWIFSSDEKEIIPNDKLAVDSSQALQTAQALLPEGVTITGSEFELTQKDSVPPIPVWRVTLWAKNKEGEDQKLGAVTILAEKNVVSESTLRSDTVVRR